MFKYLKLKYWSKLRDGIADDDMESFSHIILSQINLFGIIMLLLHVSVNISRHAVYMAFIDIVGILLLGISYALNESRHHLSAKLIFMISSNTIIFFGANLLLKETGTFLLFFPLIGCSYIFFTESRNLRTTFIILPFILIAILELFNFKIFGEILLDEEDPRIKFFINLTLAGFAFALAANYLIRRYNIAINHLKENRNTFRSLVEEIKKQNISLEKANTELDRFVYSTSHDLRSPLMSILGLINLTKIEPSEEAKNEYLAMMSDRVHKLDNFIGDIINYSRNSRQEIIYDDVDIKKLINSIINDHQFMEKVNEITFNVDIQFVGTVRTDLNRVSTILNNLTSNAIKYHRYTQEKPEINFIVSKSRKYLEIIVSDNGEGINEEDQEKVFNMFYRASDNSKGSGLGLYIVKEMIEKLKGKIELQSEQGKGCQFTIKIPL
ncbi:MAG: HAMP domain-containing histidine kinase [Cyclobacteriaceae bacterium]|nr:HAMP domain-containing histidine kinase [Cyclobacteriaceae bacterium]